MTVEEMDNMFDVLYNNITSNQAPGLNAYEKSVFLTKAQDEIIKNYFNPKSKGNNTQDGFDDSQKRQIDFSMLTTVYTKEASDKTENPTWTAGQVSDSRVFDQRTNTKNIILPTDIMMIINEMAEVRRGTTASVMLQVIPLKFDEYSRLMSKPYKRPLKFQAWRLINNSSSNSVDIIIGPNDTLIGYYLRYIKRPKPIIVSPLDGLSIDGYLGSYIGSNSATAYSKVTDTTPQTPTKGIECELDPILHQDIVQRAVELAKIAWTSTGQDNMQAMMEAGKRSE